MAGIQSGKNSSCWGGVNPLQERTSQRRPELAQGTLLHGTFYSPEKMIAIQKAGILSGEFIGIAEDNETNYCADFFRVPVDMTVAEYQKWLMEKEIRPGTTVSRNKMERSRLVTPSPRGKIVTFIVDAQQPEIENLLEQDAYSRNADPRLRSIVNEAGLLNPLGDEQTRRLSSILCGVPSNFINGIIVSSEVTPDDIAFLRTTFGDNVLIYSVTGEPISFSTQVQ